MDSKLSLIRLVSTSPDNDGLSEYAVIDDDNLELLKHTNQNQQQMINYRLALTTEATESAGIYILATEGNSQGFIGHTKLSKIRSWYEVINNVQIDHNGFISKTNN